MKIAHLTKYACFATLASAICCAGPNARADYASAMTNLHPLVYYRLNDPAVSTQFADVASNLSGLGGAANGYYLGTAGSTYSHPVTSGLIGSMTGAASFTGGFAVMPYYAAANQTTFAAEMWFDVVPGTAAVLCSSVNMDGRWGWILYYGEDGTAIVSARYYNGNGGTPSMILTTPGTVTDSAWHYAVIQDDGTTASLYVDGVLASSSAMGASTFPPAPPMPARSTFSAGRTTALYRKGWRRKWPSTPMR